MIHGSSRAIASGCVCNLCTLVREEQAGPARRVTATVPSTPVREHLNGLVESGWTIPELARHVGYHQNTLYGIHQGRTQRTSRPIAEDILTVQAKPPAPAPEYVPCLHCDRPQRRRRLCHRHWHEARAGVIPMPAQRHGSMSAETLAGLSVARRRRIDGVIEAVDDLVADGVSVEKAVDRVGWGRAAAARALYRRGRLDLARPLQRVVTAARRAA